MIRHFLIITLNRSVVTIEHNHLHVLNYDLKSSEQTNHDEGDTKRACSSSDFYIKQEKYEDNEYCKLITGLDDLLNTKLRITAR